MIISGMLFDATEVKYISFCDGTEIFVTTDEWLIDKRVDVHRPVFYFWVFFADRRSSDEQQMDVLWLYGVTF